MISSAIRGRRKQSYQNWQQRSVNISIARTAPTGKRLPPLFSVAQKDRTALEEIIPSSLKCPSAFHVCHFVHIYYMASSTALHLSFGDGGFHALDNISLLGAGLPHVIIEKILASADTARLATLGKLFSSSRRWSQCFSIFRFLILILHLVGI